MDQKQLIVRISPDGSINAETRNLYGDECLDYITVLEDLLDAQTVTSSFTEDYSRQAAVTSNYQRNDTSGQ
jgi:hypothetical protein